MDDVATTREMMSPVVDREGALVVSVSSAPNTNLNRGTGWRTPSSFLQTWTECCQDFILANMIIYFVRSEPNNWRFQNDLGQ